MRPTPPHRIGGSPLSRRTFAKLSTTLAICLALVLPALTGDRVLADDIVLQPNESSIVWGDEDVDMVLKADPEGKVRLRDFLRLLRTGKATSDQQPLAALLPDVVVDLNRFSSRALIAGANAGLRGNGTLMIEKDSDGSPLLRLRCDLKFLKTERPEFEPTLELDEKTENDQSIVVLFFHGFHGKSESFQAIRGHFRDTGLRTGCVHYDDHVSVATSAKKVAALVEQNFAGDASTRLALVGHSMGGLVAREWVENPELANPRITHLITVGSPHGGSEWAEVTPLPDLVVNGQFTPDTVLGVLTNRSTTPSAEDLRPNSAFLQTLASRPRRDGVRYTTIIGTGSPVDETTLQAVRARLLAEQQKARGGVLEARLSKLVTQFDAVCTGEGDGVVSIEQAKIPGVDDIIYVDCSHWEFFDSPEPGAVNPVWEAVAKCIAATD
ncbi:PGAP1-like alpha/beta domain-containing protein [Aporhodopirellula aestuarii]|uniref:Thioesterase domain-containing protein n=1 Tax=Aporhodopirellula aestuarii TaxID=2950107 RepID=A0ABT0U1N8_9BACT|nr:thioesterase domain-containing protein [Aporhodopirellula aestuarii]MCM2370554.1 thioesterase domain-containing protein [Aporhodopirellula aestuarii]